MRVCLNCQKLNPVDNLYCDFCAFVFADELSTRSLTEGDSAETQLTIASSDVPVTKTIPSKPVRKQTTPSITKTRSGKKQTRAKPQQMGRQGRYLADLWGPFAGMGERGKHETWLLDKQGENVGKLRSSFHKRLKHRQIPDVAASVGVLQARGIAVEQRRYFLIRRGIITVGLHIESYGEDLFISQVTYARGPIDPLRVLLVVLMLAFQTFMSAGGYGDILRSAAGTFSLTEGFEPNTQMLALLLCCIGPLGLLNTVFLLLGAAHAVYKWITIKAPLTLLRRPPNEFEQDDIIALEKAVEETVRQAMDAVGLDAALLTPASQYGFKRRFI